MKKFTIFGYTLEQIPLEMPKKEEIEIPRFLTPRLEEICLGYEKWMRMAGKDMKIPTDITSLINPTRQEIEEFCLELRNLKEKFPLNTYFDFHHYTANYLTALMQVCPEKEFVLNFNALNFDGIVLHFLGIMLERKNLIIEGNVGGSLGKKATNCAIEVRGNAGNYAGIHADTCDIEVKGKVADYLGESARNCRIEVEDYETLSLNLFANTEIFCQGNKIWPE